MVSCRLVGAAAAVAATLTGLLLSNWWIILLLIWPPKAGNARLFLAMYKLLLCYYTLWKKNIQLLFTEELVQSTLNTIYRSCHSHVDLWTFLFLRNNGVDLSAFRASHRTRCLSQIWGHPLRLWTVVRGRKDSHPTTERKMDSVTQSIHSKCQCVIDCASLAPRRCSPPDQYYHYPNYAVG